MTTLARTRTSSDPRCWWCHISTPPDSPYRGTAPELGLPTGVGVVVCSPACPDRPDGVVVWKRGDE